MQLTTPIHPIYIISQAYLLGKMNSSSRMVGIDSLLYQNSSRKDKMPGTLSLSK